MHCTFSSDAVPHKRICLACLCEAVRESRSAVHTQGYGIMTWSRPGLDKRPCLSA